MQEDIEVLARGMPQVRAVYSTPLTYLNAKRQDEVATFYPFSQCEICVSLRVCRDSQTQPPLYFRGG